MRFPLICILTLALMAPLGAFADNHEQPDALVDVWVMVPKKGMEAEFEKAAAEHIAFRAEKGDSRQWQAYTPVIGDRIDMVQFRACCFDWDDMDAYVVEAEEKGFGQHWNENVHPYVDHYHHYLERFDWEHSHWPQDAGPFKYFGVTTWDWKQNPGPESSEARKKFSKIAKEEGWAGDEHQWLWSSRIGGKSKLLLVIPHADYADMAPPETTFYEFMTSQMDEEEADAIFDDFGSGFSSSDFTIWMHRGDMSINDSE